MSYLQIHKAPLSLHRHRCSENPLGVVWGDIDCVSRQSLGISLWQSDVAPKEYEFIKMEAICFSLHHRHGLTSAAMKFR